MVNECLSGLDHLSSSVEVLRGVIKGEFSNLPPILVARVLIKTVELHDELESLAMSIEDAVGSSRKAQGPK